ncbi:hypothetical protein HZA33_03560 [Candidatus Pacearchaeota archaeon]|nr:hypothetical protein [Candidatus Pacearchaeota archaeon]
MISSHDFVQPDAYVKKQFDFGTMAVAYKRQAVGKADALVVSYFGPREVTDAGMKGIFERVIFLDGKVYQEDAGAHGTSGVKYKSAEKDNGEAGCPIILSHQKEVGELVDECYAQLKQGEN